MQIIFRAPCMSLCRVARCGRGRCSWTGEEGHAVLLEQSPLLALTEQATEANHLFAGARGPREEGHPVAQPDGQGASQGVRPAQLGVTRMGADLFVSCSGCSRGSLSLLAARRPAAPPCCKEARSAPLLQGGPQRPLAAKRQARPGARAHPRYPQHRRLEMSVARLLDPPTALVARERGGERASEKGERASEGEKVRNSQEKPRGGGGE